MNTLKAISTLIGITESQADEMTKGQSLKQALFNASTEDSQGIGISKIKKIEALQFLVKEAMTEEAQTGLKITSSNDAKKVLSPYLSGLTVEHFYIIILNRNNMVMRVESISQGGQAGTVADPKLIFGKALKYNASSIILAHNHPSGNKKPSDADIAMTRQLVEAGKNLTLPVLDHIIFTDYSYTSFCDEGLI